MAARDQGATSYDSVPGRSDDGARDKFGGLNVGAAFFGWLIVVAVSVLLIAIVSAVLSAVGSQVQVTQSDAERSAGTIGLTAGIVLLVVLALAYYTGGYVAGRMSRFNGPRQGLGVWLISVVATAAAIALGAVFGSKYNVLEQVNLPELPISTDQFGLGVLVTAVAVVVLTLLAAMLGGAMGHRYHNRVDRAARL